VDKRARAGTKKPTRMGEGRKKEGGNLRNAVPSQLRASEEVKKRRKGLWNA